MNDVAQARPRTWTPHLILFSVVLHAVVIYYVAVAFEIVPPLVPTTADPPTIRVFTPPTPVPPKPETERIVQPRPIFNQRIPAPTPAPSPVEPSPLTPTTNVPAGPPTVLVGQPIPEQPISQALPRYPTVAEARGIEGRVTLSITIMPDGSVRDVRVVNANPSGYFEDAAVRAVQRWRYRPSNVTRTNVIVQMDFELKDA
jgi:protein TonB